MTGTDGIGRVSVNKHLALETPEQRLPCGAVNCVLSGLGRIRSCDRTAAECGQFHHSALTAPVTSLTGQLIRDRKKAPAIQRAASEIPAVTLEASVQPITRRVLRVRLTITPDFR